MQYSFPHDVAQQVQSFLESGRFGSEDDVLRDALDALAQRQRFVAMVEQGIAEHEAGLCIPAEELDEELRRDYEGE